MTAPLPLADISESHLQLQNVRSRSKELVLYGLVGLTLLAVLAFGAVETWAISVLEISVALLTAIWVTVQIRRGAIVTSANPVFPPMTAFVAIIALQVVAGISRYGYATSSALMLYITYGCACFLMVQTLTRTSDVRRISIALTSFGTSLALFAVLQSLTSNGKIYWLRTPRFGGWIYGPYVNHNHYAGLMEMLAPIPLVFAFSKYAHGRKRWLAAGAAAFMGATIFLSGSRGGMTAYSLQIALFFWFLFRERTRNGVVLVLSAFLLSALASVAWIGGSEVSERISTVASHKQADLRSDIRGAIYQDALHMVAKRPVLGSGINTFADVYPQFRSFYTNQTVNRAHNDYLELLTDSGFVGFGVGIWFLAAALRPAIRKARIWTADVNGAVALSALLGISGILVHSLVDFNLQIPANAMLFYILCTLAAMDTQFRNYRREHRRPASVAASSNESTMVL
ncbi:MAG TPA: O-antigen ligase family protein [Terriglobales bacterium]|nr:O-antigen ligase family protein [Terriglobales bacterium]